MATDSARCKYCGTEWEFQTTSWRRSDGRGGHSGFIWATIYAHLYWCERATPEQRLAFIDRNEKRLAKKPNLHTIVYFDRNHPGVAQSQLTMHAQGRRESPAKNDLSTPEADTAKGDLSKPARRL
jgi:hypothetical protein